MNEKASQLGLTNTHFETPHGLDSEQHYTTAYELALLSNYAMRNKTFATIVNTKMCTITINGYPKVITNTNELLGNLNGVYGIKTGFTNGANRCLVSCCKRGNLDVICVVLGADTKKFRTSDSIKLLEYTFQNFELTNIEQQAREEFANWKATHENCFFVEKGVSNVVSFALSKFETSVIPLHKDKKNSLDVEIHCDMDFVAPLEANSNIGELVVTVDSQTIATVPIVTTEAIPKKSMWDYFFLFFKNFASYVQI